MRGWLTGTAAALVLAWLAVMSFFVVSRIDQSTVDGFEFVPPDGFTSRIVHGADHRPASRENAIIEGTGVQFAVPKRPLDLSGPPPGADPADVWWWRETLSRASAGDRPGESRETVRSVTPQALRLHAHLGTPNGVTFTPALVELPGDAAVGKAWSSEGTLRQGRGNWQYRNESSASEPRDRAQADHGCLEVTSRTTVTDGRVPQSFIDVGIWCPRLGLIEGTSTLGEPVDRFDGSWEVPAPGRTRFKGPTDPAAAPMKLAARSTDPAFGSAPIPDDVGLLNAVTADGTLVTVSSVTQGLVASRIGTTAGVTPALATRWWAKPAGTILTLSSFGNQVVVTTSSRDVIAYSSTGRRLWRVPLSDVVMEAPRQLDDGQLVVATVRGEIVGIDPAGRRGWSHQSDGSRAPRLRADGLEVYVAGGKGVVECLGPDGKPVWRTTVAAAGEEPLTVLPLGSTVLLTNTAGWFIEVDRGTGRQRDDYFAGSAHAYFSLVPGDDRVALADGWSAVQILDPRSRRITGTIPGGRHALWVDGGWLVVTGDSLVRTDESGAELGRRPLAPSSSRNGVQLLASSDTWWILHPAMSPAVEVVR